MRHGWVHMFITHLPTLTLPLHNFDLFRTCRTSSFCTVAWQLANFKWHDASRGPSVIAELLVLSVVGNFYVAVSVLTLLIGNGKGIQPIENPLHWFPKIFLPARRYASAGTSYGPMSVCHNSEFCKNGWTNRAGFWHGSFLLPSFLHCVERKLGYLQK